jgi:hypothetical protein
MSIFYKIAAVLSFAALVFWAFLGFALSRLEPIHSADHPLPLFEYEAYYILLAIPLGVLWAFAWLLTALFLPKRAKNP